MAKQQQFKTKMNVFSTDNTGRSGLMYAWDLGHNNTVEYLLRNVYSEYKHDAESLENLLINKKDNSRNALHSCAAHGNDEAIDKLFAFCPGVCKTLCNVGDDKFGMTPFFTACYHNKLECAKKLITSKNVNMGDKDGFSPFYGAVFNGNDKITNFLCNNSKYEVDITKEDLNLAVEKGYTTIVCQILLREMQRKNIANVDGLKKCNILSLSMVDEWLIKSHSNNSLGLFSFLTRLKEFGLKKENKFSYIKTLLNINTHKVKNDATGQYEKMRKGTY